MHQFETKVEESDLESLRQRLASRTVDERAAAEGTLDRLAVRDLVDLMAIEQRHRKRRTKWMAIGIALYLVFLVTIASVFRNGQFIMMFAGLTSVIATVASAFTPSHKNAALRLAQYDDVTGVGPLIDALEIPDPNVLAAVREGLTHTFKRLRSSDSALLGLPQRKMLVAQLNMRPLRKTRDAIAPFLVSTLSALEQLGDKSFVECVQGISSGRGFGAMPEVREAAESCLPALMQRVENDRLNHGLLRGSSAGKAGGQDLLLRPADSADRTGQDELLRATTNKQSPPY